MSESDARDLRAALREAATVLGVSLTEAQLEKLACYAGLVVRWNKFANLTGARDELAFAHKFIADALAVARFVRGPMVADLGSGSGLPGIVLAILEPAWQLVLVEARSRRARFLSQVRIELALDNVQVAATRIEHWQPLQLPDTIVCQAVGTLSLILSLTAHLHAPDTRVLALKGQFPGDELAELGERAAACEVRELAVPGWAQRHLVTIDCGRLAPAV